MENIGSSWHSYPKVYAIGHSAIKELFDEDVIVQEKIDGSQISFGVFDGELKIRSKGKQMVLDAPEKMFELAVAQIQARVGRLKPGWTYRGEYLMKPKHNVLCYERMPRDNIIIFDVNSGQEEYLSYKEMMLEADRIGFEFVPTLFEGKISESRPLEQMLETISTLGGVPVEGVVCKNYKRFNVDGKAMMGKHVSERFKEKHNKDWKLRNPQKGDLVQTMILQLKTEARWEKAIQHLRDNGELENSPKDIGALMKELHRDFDEECAEDVKEKLYKWAAPKIKRGICGGFPEWYKKRLLESQFDKELDEFLEDIEPEEDESPKEGDRYIVGPDSDDSGKWNSEPVMAICKGCGQSAIVEFKNGEWICSECGHVREDWSDKKKGRKE